MKCFFLGMAYHALITSTLLLFGVKITATYQLLSAAGFVIIFAILLGTGQ